MTMPYTLYYAPDNASLCVRLMLLEIGAEFDTALVDRAKHGQRAPAYLALNPNGLIPTLQTPQGPIHETGAILLWLSDTHDRALTAGHTRGDLLRWLFWLSNTLHPALRMHFYPQKYIDGAATDMLGAATRRNLADHFAHLDAHADWLDDTSPSLLGCYAAPLIRWAALYGPDQAWFDIHNYPRLHAFAKRAETRPSAHQAAIAEGLGQTIFSAPSHPNPPQGSAT